MAWSETKKRKRKGFFSRLKDKIAGTSWQKEYYHNLRIIFSNNLTRLVFNILDLALIVLLLYFLSISLGQITNIVGQLVTLFIFFVLLYVPFIYLYRSANQLNFETSLNLSISSARYYIGELEKPKTIKNYRSLQGRINRVRENLKDFVEYSEILSPPIFNYELDRLQKRIDIFFNCTSEVLVPIKKLFSFAEEFEQEVARAQMENEEVLPEDEVLEMEEERMRDMTGEITDFDLRAMDEFMHFLSIVLFEKEAKRYSPFAFKHPVNLIVLSRFLDRWNSTISSCPNCKEVFEKASKDIEDYYKKLGRIESKRRQRMWELRDAIILVVLSVGLSTLVQYLIQHAPK